MVDGDGSYMDTGGDLASVCNSRTHGFLADFRVRRLIPSEPKPQWSSAMQPLNAVIQSTAVELLQLIVARGDVDSISTGSIEAIVVGKLYFSIHMVRLDLQNKLLHLLHSLISALAANLETVQRNAVSSRPEESQPDSATAQEKAY